MQDNNNQIIIFIILSTAMLFLLAGLIISILYMYQKRLYYFKRNMNNMILDHEKNLLTAQVEIQEQTFQEISKEIHDNISLSLTLAKLNLNTLDWKNVSKLSESISSSVQIIGTAINELSNLSRSMNSEIIKNLGLHKAIRMELERVEQIAQIQVHFKIEGDPVFMNCQKELVLFRIIQEAFNNIIKHSNATIVNLNFKYNQEHLDVLIEDNGSGFTPSEINYKEKMHAGLINMKNRAKAFGGTLELISSPNSGTKICITAPYF
jgi:two-component system, NarL family, sensor kinase